MTKCDRVEEIGDYAFDELDAALRPALEQHIAQCADCGAELDQLRLTTAALRILPDQEIPQRIAFVSDQVFEPKPATGWLARFWNSGPRLGFASACVLAAALIVAGYMRPAEVRTVTTGGLSAADVSRQVDTAVARAVTQVRLEVRAEDAQFTRAALEAADRKHEREHSALMVAMEENLTVLQKRYSTLTMLASSDAARFGAGQ